MTQQVIMLVKVEFAPLIQGRQGVCNQLVKQKWWSLCDSCRGVIRRLRDPIET